MSLDYATVIEKMADTLGEAPCLYYGDKILGWREYDDRASRISGYLAGQGLKKDSKIGLFMYNCCEYMEATAAAFKNRSIPININYRYVGEELIYLLTDCEAEALIFHTSLGEQVAAIKDKLPNLKVLISVDDDGNVVDGAVPYEDIIATVEPAQRIERSPEDTLMLYTGGTTGMPKGVEYKLGELLAQMMDVGPMFFGIKKAESLDDLTAQALERYQQGTGFVSLPASPLMHTAGILNSGILMQILGGAMVILQSRSFDPRELWQAVVNYKVNHMVVVGDTFVKPMLKAIDEDKQAGVEYDLSTMKAMVSSGVIFSQESKLRLLELADMTIMDGAGATEGAMAFQLSSRANPPSETASFTALPTTEIFNENYEMVLRGSGEAGLIGMGGTLPQGYYKDSVKTEKTFRVLNGHRYGFTGDMGTINSNGTMKFLGRGSGCVNTGGEKVYPEEVEEVVKRHPNVIDCLVAGLPDDRFGERVAAVVSLNTPVSDITAELMDFCGEFLARYKLPRTIKVAEHVQRAPNGKADYKWAKAFLLDS